jgi:hypothetical protein
MLRTQGWRGAGAALAMLLAHAAAFAFQLAPLGSSFEARFTNESPSFIGQVAGRAGRLLKEPVHEEMLLPVARCCAPTCRATCCAKARTSRSRARM